MNNRYIYHIKRKGKYLSISNNLTEGYEDLCIDKDSIKETNLKYYIYENNEWYGIKTNWGVKVFSYICTLKINVLWNYLRDK